MSWMVLVLGGSIALVLAASPRAGGEPPILRPGVKVDVPPEDAAMTRLKEAERFEEEGKTIEALRETETAVRLRPKWAVAHVRRGQILLAAGRIEEARRAFEEALKIVPILPEAKTGLGMTFAREKNWPEAEKRLRDALTLNPDPVRALYEMGRVLEAQGRFKEAAETYKTAITKLREGRR